MKYEVIKINKSKPTVLKSRKEALVLNKGVSFVKTPRINKSILAEIL